MPRSLLLVACAALSACGGIVRSSQLRPDYALYDRTQTLRLRVSVSPLPAGSEAVARLWARIARKYVNDRRDFIAKAEAIGPEAAAAPCEDGIQGTLVLEPTARQVGEGVETELMARLVRCDPFSTLVWSAESGGTFPSNDSLYVETAATYAASLGDEVRPFVGPAMRLLQATLERLPEPARDEAVVDEKIELGE